MRKKSTSLLICAALLLTGTLAHAQWVNSSPNTYITGTVGIGLNAAPTTNKLEVQTVNEISVLYLRHAKNNGGSGNAAFLRDDRGYGGNNTGTTFKIESWRGLNQQGGTLINFTTIDNGFEKSRFFIDNNLGYVGFGTTTPRGKFDVDGPGHIYLSDDPNAGTDQNLYLPGHVFLSPYNGTNVSYFQARRENTTGSTSLQFRTTNAGSVVEAMMLTNAGRVGIGTTDPQASLDIRQADASVNITASNATGGGIGRPVLYINRISEGLKLEYVPNVLARISNTYVGPSGHMAFSTSGQDRIIITGQGNVGIGTSMTGIADNNVNGYKLAVKGIIGAHEVRVENTSTTWADYVFEPDYELMSLSEVDNFVKTNKHLPGIPSKKEVEEEGHNLGAMDVLLLKKVEELTLYMIELKKENDALRKEIDLLKQ